MNTQVTWKRLLAYMTVILAMLSCQLPTDLLGREEEVPAPELLLEIPLVEPTQSLSTEIIVATEPDPPTIANSPTPESVMKIEQTIETEEPPIIPDEDPTPFEERSVNLFDDADLIYVPAGEFLMGYQGSDAEEDEGPEHMVFLDGFWLYETPVTNSQYRQCILDERCSGNLSRFPDDDYPAVRVDWFQAFDYCDWVGARLPTEAEWEKGARGTDGRLFPWGDQSPTCLLANFKGCYGNQVTQVGQFPEGVSPYGALDMLGTVWEWVSDWYAVDYYAYSPYANPTGPSEGEFKVQRGHSFESNQVYLRIADRGRSNPASDDYRKGFRCVIPELP